MTVNYGKNEPGGGGGGSMGGGYSGSGGGGDICARGTIPTRVSFTKEDIVSCGPRRVECKDCTYWNQDVVRNHRTELPKFWGIGMCEKSPDSRATGLKMACYEGHHDASLWPKRNILMRKF